MKESLDFYRILLLLSNIQNKRKRWLTMIGVICGEKGSGKTKKMLELANNAMLTSKGEIVFLDVKDKTAFDLHRNIRFVNVKEFFVNSREKFYGFINGLIAGNYDIDEIYVDNLLNIIKTDIYDLEFFLNDLKEISEKYQVNFIFSANCEKNEIPTHIENYVIALT